MTLEIDPVTYPNWTRWRKWCENFNSPWSYIDFGWMFTVLSGLQRRVWLGKKEGTPLYANSYIIFIGSSGVGKGNVLSEVSGLLTHHRYVPHGVNGSTVEKLEDALNPKLLFSMAPHDTTYESLTRQLAEAVRPFRYNEATKERVYSHSSMSAVLEELGTLFKRRENHGMSKFLLQIYDCKDYNYVTATRGSAIIKSPWLSILAGCTPKFLPEGIQQGILEDGTVSRMLFIFETQDRPTDFFREQPDDVTINGRRLLLEHLKSLSRLYGEVSFDPAARTFLDNWWKSVPIKKLAFSAKMESYFARIKVHVIKLAFAVHFSEKTDMTITLNEAQMAVRLLETIEQKMDIGFSAAGRNVYSGISKEILQFIAEKDGEYVSEADLLDRFNCDLTYEELDKQLTELVLMDKLAQQGKSYALKH
jgi:hypothetical protein